MAGFSLVLGIPQYDSWYMFICLVRTSVRVGGEIHTTASMYVSIAQAAVLVETPAETCSSHASAVQLRGEYCPATTRSLP